MRGIYLGKEPEYLDNHGHKPSHYVSTVPNVFGVMDEDQIPDGLQVFQVLAPIGQLA
jgi:hypothetical protein